LIVIPKSVSEAWFLQRPSRGEGPCVSKLRKQKVPQTSARNEENLRALAVVGMTGLFTASTGLAPIGLPRFARDVKSSRLVLRRTVRTIHYDLVATGTKFLLEVIPSSSLIDILPVQRTAALFVLDDSF
jgi:hypothetical protein